METKESKETTSPTPREDSQTESFAQRSYRLMPLRIYTNRRLRMILPCPNCFITQTIEGKEGQFCAGCVYHYTKSKEWCEISRRQHQEQFGTHEGRCHCQEWCSEEKCLYTKPLEQWGENYTADEIKAIWGRVNWDNIQRGDRVVGLSTAHSDTDEPCLNCYGYNFPCSTMCNPMHYGVLSYSRCREQHVASFRLPVDYDEYMLLTHRQIGRMIQEAWDERDNPEGKDDGEGDGNESVHGDSDGEDMY